MAWFSRSKKNIEETQQRDMPDGLWTKCPSCDEVMYKTELEDNYYVCKNCSYHFRILGYQYIDYLLDKGSFEEKFENIRSADPLGFTDSKPYKERLAATYKKTETNDAITTGTGKINGKNVCMAAMNFNFIGGSMGSVVGEKFKRAALLSIEEKIPFINISASGGARMQEAALSLMQLAKTSASLAKLSEAGIPYISILTDPTTGGLSASHAMLGDVNIAEPGALIGFAGPRVIEQTIKKKLPAGFQRSEFLLEKGFLDFIVNRKDMKEKLYKLICWFEG